MSICTLLYAQEEKLNVSGAIVISNSEKLPPDSGTIQWTGTDFQGWNGTNWVSLTMPMDGTTGLVSDIDGNKYITIKIGTQIWMTENLRTTKYNNGNPIPLVSNNLAWENLSSPGFSWYNNDSTTYAMPYGAMYNYYALSDTSSMNVCPMGWHIPSNQEWTILTSYLGGGSPAGGKMKEAGLAHWTSPNTGGTNESGFNALPGGFRFWNGTFVNILNNGDYWSSSSLNATRAWYRFLFFDNTSASQFDDDKKLGFSARCLKN